MSMIQTVLLAIKDKAPQLHRQLRANGELNQYAADLAEQIQENVGIEARKIAEHHGYSKLLKTEPMKAVGVMNMAGVLAREIVLAQMLEFPPEETSPPSQD